MGEKDNCVVRAENILSDLNSSQYSAATFDNKHCLVLAGAGSGKTKTIIARAIYLILQGVPANRIQILSFTRKSSSEIYERVRLCIGGENSKALNTSTFHTWCLGILRANAKIFGKNNFVILDREDQLQFFRRFRGKHAKGSFPSAEQILEVYSYTRNIKSSLSNTLKKKLPEFFALKDKIIPIMQMYEQRKNESQYIDYDDILDLVSAAINTYEEVAEYIGKQYDYILVDEMQDTNPLQWSLLEPLSKYCTLFCVGDDAQSIYGFRGADFKIIHSFSEHIPSSTILKLEDNYRSTQEILDLANWLINKSPLNYDKNLKSVRGKGKKPCIHEFENEITQGRFVAENIEKRKEQGDSFSNSLILVRSMYSARSIETVLIQKNIPYQVFGGMKFLEAAHIKDVLSLLRIIANNKDEIAWMRYLLLWEGIGDVSASFIIDAVILENNIESSISILETEKDKYKNNTNVVECIKQVIKKKHEPSVAVKLAVEVLFNRLSIIYKNEQWEKRKNDFSSLEHLAEKYNTLEEFIDSCIVDPMAVGVLNISDTTDKVTISTIHSAKGLECDNCYVVDVSEGVYPNSLSIESLDDIEEERRVLYVALTRAKNELIITRVNKSNFMFDKKDDKGNLLEMYFLNGLPKSLADIVNHKQDKGLPEAFNTGKPLNIKVGIDFS